MNVSDEEELRYFFSGLMVLSNQTDNGTHVGVFTTVDRDSERFGPMPLTDPRLYTEQQVSALQVKISCYNYIHIFIYI